MCYKTYFTAFLIVMLLFPFTGLSQDETWLYLRAHDSSFEPQFEKKGDLLAYDGTDRKLKQILERYSIKTFKKTYRNASRANLKKTFFVQANSDDILNDLLSEASHLFHSGELIPEKDKKIFEPNDYGLTSTIGANIGAQANLDYLDFIGVPQAWYYTTGSRDIVIGVSDGSVDSTDIEFAGKTTGFRKTPYSKGHGISVAASAAAQGNNGYGIPGVCYDCSIYSTTYGNTLSLADLVEISEAGAKVINCSWGTTRYYEDAQQAVYKMLDNGTLIVATGGNKPFLTTNGEWRYYPATYDKVIGISSGMHRYEDYRENIKQVPHNDGVLYYAENVRWYVGSNAGFVDNDTTQVPVTLYKRSVKNLNTDLDIIGPAQGVFRYSEYYQDKSIDESDGQTSGVAPLISGTIGLMFSLYPCLPADEVEGIMKMTATNLDHVEANKPYIGLYGAGMLHTGRAVEMVFKLYAEGETAYIENQDFPRWDFKLTSLSEEVRFRNQKFRDSSTLALKAKNRIVLEPGTILKPDRKGRISLTIDSSLEKECDLVLRDPSILEKD